VLPSGGTPSTEQTSDATDSLNALIKAFAADGMPVWAITSTSFTVVDGTNTYTIGPSKTIDIEAAPLKVFQATRTPSGGVNIPMNIIDRNTFKNLPESNGTPINLYYQPVSTDGVPTGIINLWPTPDESTTTIEIQYQRPFDDMDATDNNFDFPSYWIQALTYNLAWALSPEYGIPPTDRGILQKEALYWKDQALSYGSEEGSVYIQPMRY
jgi:hypothetical protein